MPSAISAWLRRTLWVVAGVAVVGGVAYAWMPRPTPVEVGPVTRGPLTVTVDEDGETRFDDRYVVSAPLSGTLSRVELEAGDTVSAGETFARIESVDSPLLDPRARQAARSRVSSARAALRRAEASVEAAKSARDFAQQDLVRQQELLREGIGTRRALEEAQFRARSAESDLASARFAVQVARHELEAARTALAAADESTEQREQVEVSLPVDGVVLEVMRESRGVVGAGEPLVAVGRPESLEIVVDVLTADAVEITRGARVIVEQWGGPAPLEGRVRRVEPSAFTKVSSLGVEEQRVNVIVDLESPAEEWRSLGDGFRVEARIVTWSSENALQVDASATFRSGDGWAVFRLEEGRASRQPVEIGQRTSRSVQIVDGLEEGQRVILYPSDAVRDGGAVRVVER